MRPVLRAMHTSQLNWINSDRFEPHMLDLMQAEAAKTEGAQSLIKHQAPAPSFLLPTTFILKHPVVLFPYNGTPVHKPSDLVAHRSLGDVFAQPRFMVARPSFRQKQTETPTQPQQAAGSSSDPSPLASFKFTTIGQEPSLLSRLSDAQEGHVEYPMSPSSSPSPGPPPVDARHSTRLTLQDLLTNASDAGSSAPAVNGQDLLAFASDPSAVKQDNIAPFPPIPPTFILPQGEETKAVHIDLLNPPNTARSVPTASLSARLTPDRLDASGSAARVKVRSSNSPVDARITRGDDIFQRPQPAVPQPPSPTELIALIGQVALERAEWNGLQTLMDRCRVEHEEYLSRNDDTVRALHREREQAQRVFGTAAAAFAKLEFLHAQQEQRWDTEQQKAERALADAQRLVQERKRAEEAAEAARKAAAEAEQEAAEAEQREAERKAAEEAERKAAEETERKAAEEAERRRQAVEEEQRRVAEEQRKAAEEEQRKAAEEQQRMIAEEEKRRAAEEEKRRAAEEERRKAAEEEQRKIVEEKAAEERQQKAEEAARKELQAEQEQKRAEIAAMKRAIWDDNVKKRELKARLEKEKETANSSSAAFTSSSAVSVNGAPQEGYAVEAPRASQPNKPLSGGVKLSNAIESRAAEVAQAIVDSPLTESPAQHVRSKSQMRPPLMPSASTNSAHVAAFSEKNAQHTSTVTSKAKSPKRVSAQPAKSQPTVDGNAPRPQHIALGTSGTAADEKSQLLPLKQEQASEHELLHPATAHKTGPAPASLQHAEIPSPPPSMNQLHPGGNPSASAALGSNGTPGRPARNTPTAAPQIGLASDVALRPPNGDAPTQSLSQRITHPASNWQQSRNLRERSADTDFDGWVNSAITPADDYEEQRHVHAYHERSPSQEREQSPRYTHRANEYRSSPAGRSTRTERPPEPSRKRPREEERRDFEQSPHRRQKLSPPMNEHSQRQYSNSYASARPLRSPSPAYVRRGHTPSRADHGVYRASPPDVTPADERYYTSNTYSSVPYRGDYDNRHAYGTSYGQSHAPAADWYRDDASSLGQHTPALLHRMTDPQQRPNAGAAWTGPRKKSPPRGPAHARDATLSKSRGSSRRTPNVRGGAPTARGGNGPSNVRGPNNHTSNARGGNGNAPNSFSGVDLLLRIDLGEGNLEPAT